MIRHYLKDSLHWLHLYCFRQQAFDWKVDYHSGWDVVLKLYPWFFLAGLMLLIVIGISCEFVGISFNWPRAFGGAVLGGLGVGIFGVGFGGGLGGPLGGLVGSLFGGLGASLGGIWAGGLNIGLAGGLFFGTFYALTSWNSSGLNADLSNVGKSGRSVTYLLGIILGLLVLLFAGLDDTIQFALSFFPMTFLTSVFFIKRPFYRPLHSVQFLRAYKDKQWLAHFRNSPTHWDETIGTQLPFLSDWLFEIAKDDSEEGLKEVVWVAAKRPFQRKSAQEALERLAVHRLTEIDSIFGLQRVTKAIDFLPTDNLLFPMIDENGKPFLMNDEEKPPDTFRLIPSSFYMARPYLEKIAERAADYAKRQTPKGKYAALTELGNSVFSFFRAASSLVPAFSRVAWQWEKLIGEAETKLRDEMPTENPYIAGLPLREEEHYLFKGRRDLAFELEDSIINSRRQPALLLYGRRRAGKTSTLLNLTPLFNGQFICVYVDLQNMRFSASDALFCYYLSDAIYGELAHRQLTNGLAQPQKQDYEQHPFPQLDEFLDALEIYSRHIGKQILLTFDEYEKLEEGIRDGKVTHAVLNQIRAIVQHRERLIVLFSGSHRFEELHAVNWSDYLINVQTLHLSFLARDEARELIEHPTPEFALGYAPSVVDRILDLTHGQPYLVQALGWELVSRINREKRKEATAADLEAAIERVLESAEGYFENTWRDCTENEQAVLRALAVHQPDGLSATERAIALQGLQRKELVEQRDGQWHYLVELIRLWVVKNRVVPSILEAELQAA